MVNNLRNSSIEGIENIRWGTHIGQIFSSFQDYFSIAVPFLKAGLLSNELCLWIYSQNVTKREILDSLASYIKDVEKYFKNGQLELIPYTDWYFEDNLFNEFKAREHLKEYMSKSLKSGFEGLRIVDDTSWLEKIYLRSFESYENYIDKMLSELPFILLCLYDKNEVDILQMAEIINNHDYIIIGDEGKHKIIKNVELIKKENQLGSLEEYDEIRAEYITNLSHELRTPLNVITSIVQMLEMDKKNFKDEKSSMYLKLLKQNSLRLIRLVNNVIDITKLDTDFYEIKKVNYDIVNLIDKITESVSQYAASKGIMLKFESNVDSKIIACDPDKIEKIILNLLSNAIKFTDHGGKIRVLVKDLEDKIIISVKDNGIGIPKDKQKSIFNRFEQVGTFARQQGSGIGLSLVKALIEKHDGKIFLESEEGKGSEFIIELPCMLINDYDDKKVTVKNHFINNLVERVMIEFSDIYS